MERGRGALYYRGFLGPLSGLPKNVKKRIRSRSFLIKVHSPFSFSFWGGRGTLRLHTPACLQTIGHIWNVTAVSQLLHQLILCTCLQSRAGYNKVDWKYRMENVWLKNLLMEYLHLVFRSTFPNLQWHGHLLSILKFLEDGEK